MSGNTRIPHSEALFIANRLVEAMRPHCDKLMIAGSIRRQVQMVGDIEIVALPTWRRELDLFGDPVKAENLLYRWATTEAQAMGIKWTKGLAPVGGYWKADLPTGESLDLFLPKPAGWVAQVLIRTGSAEFTHGVVAHAPKRGYRFDDGVLKRGGEVVPVGDERELFDLLGLKWVEPQHRSGYGAIRYGGQGR